MNNNPKVNLYSKTSNRLDFMKTLFLSAIASLLAVSRIFAQGDLRGIAAGAGSTIASCTAGSNLSHGISVDAGGTVQGSTTRANGDIGIWAAGNGSHIMGNTCDVNQRGIHTATDANRIDGNSCTSNTVLGFSVGGNGNLFIRNSARGNATNYSVSATGATGPFVSPDGFGRIVSTSPWANFIH